MPDGYELSVFRLSAEVDAPRLVLLHGLEGSPRSHYVGNIMADARDQGWGVDLVVFRTCDGRIAGARRSYHSGETGDLDAVVRHLTREHPRSLLGLVGISLGGNVALKWLGERGHDLPTQIRAAVAVSVPFDLARSSRRIDVGVSRIYSRYFLKSLRAKALSMVDEHPDLASREKIEKATTLWAFDDAFTSVTHGFSDAADYYARSSSMHYLDRISVPTLLLASGDDPFHPRGVLDRVSQIAAQNPNLILEFPHRGGHVGFIEGTFPWHFRSYLRRRVSEFMRPWFERARVARSPAATSPAAR
jgi:predicted alpha/beta-fold hydrolase